MDHLAWRSRTACQASSIGTSTSKVEAAGKACWGCNATLRRALFSSGALGAGKRDRDSCSSTYRISIQVLRCTRASTPLRQSKRNAYARAMSYERRAAGLGILGISKSGS